MRRSAKTQLRGAISRRFTTVELVGVGVATAPQRRSEEVEDRAVIERENDRDHEVDRRRVVHGGPGRTYRTCYRRPAVGRSNGKMTRSKSEYEFVSKVWTDPFTYTKK